MRSMLAIVTAALLGFAQAAWADTEITFYYPIAVGGPLTKVIDGYARQFEQEHPGIKVNPIYAGNYDDARIKALAALKAGQSAPLSVLYSIDLYELIEQDVIVAWDDVATTPDDKAWLKAFYPALMMNGTYKGKAEIEAIAKPIAGADLNREIIVYCDTGKVCTNWWLALTDLLGYKNVKVYDGSSMEWMADPAAPVEP